MSQPESAWKSSEWVHAGKMSISPLWRWILAAGVALNKGKGGEREREGRTTKDGDSLYPWIRGRSHKVHLWFGLNSTGKQKSFRKVLENEGPRFQEIVESTVLIDALTEEGACIGGLVRPNFLHHEFRPNEAATTAQRRRKGESTACCKKFMQVWISRLPPTH